LEGQIPEAYKEDVYSKVGITIEPEITYTLFGKTYKNLRDAVEAWILHERGQQAVKKLHTLTGMSTPEYRMDLDRNITSQMEAIRGKLGDQNPLVNVFKSQLNYEKWKNLIGPVTKVYQDVYKELGVLTSEYYSNQLVEIQHAEQNAKLIIDDKLAERLASRKRYILEEQKLRTEALKMSTAQEKAAEQVYKDTKVVTPNLEKILRYESAKRIRTIQTYGSEEEKAQIPEIALRDELNIYKKLNESKITIDEEYYKNNKIMTDRLYTYKEEVILKEKDILEEAGMNRIRATGMMNERLKQLDRERAAGLSVAFGKDSTASSGFQAYLLNLEATSTTVAQRWQQRWTTMIQGTKQSVDTFFFSFFQSETKSLIDSLKSFGESFKRMVDKMASDLISSGLMRALFGKMYAGDATGYGIFGGLFSTGGSSTPSFGSYNTLGSQARHGGGSVRHGYPYIVGEGGPELFVPGKNGTIVPSNKLGASSGGNVEVVVNNYSGQQAKVTESRGPDNMRRMLVTIGASDITGGGPMARAMEQTYGVKRQGRPV
jgi:hypothetical protein